MRICILTFSLLKNIPVLSLLTKEFRGSGLVQLKIVKGGKNDWESSEHTVLTLESIDSCVYGRQNRRPQTN